MLARGCPRMRRLEMEGYAEVSDRGLTALAGGCASLECLNLWVCSSVTDAGVRDVAQSCAAHYYVSLVRSL